MKNSILASIFSLAIISTGCSKNDPVEPEMIIEAIFPVLVSRDSITVGEHLGIEIASDADQVYGSLQELQQTIGLQYVNVVSDGFADVNALGSRIPLYQSIFLDERKGTETGVQINFEAGKVKNIYLNNLQKLNQWPLKEDASTSVRIADNVEDLHAKLVKIQSKSAYANKFERISLFTKILATQYDSEMTGSRQWYFRYLVEKGLYEEVKINLENGKVKYLEVSRYRDPS